MVEENDNDTVARVKTREADSENVNRMVAVLVEEAVVVADSVVLVVAVVVVDHLEVEAAQVGLLVVLVTVDQLLEETITELQVVLQLATTGATNPHLLRDLPHHNRMADYLTVEPTTVAPITAEDRSHHNHNRTGTRGTTSKCRTGSNNNHHRVGVHLRRSNSNTKHSSPSPFPLATNLEYPSTPCTSL